MNILGCENHVIGPSWHDLPCCLYRCFPRFLIVNCKLPSSPCLFFFGVKYVKSNGSTWWFVEKFLGSKPLLVSTFIICCFVGNCSQKNWNNKWAERIWGEWVCSEPWKWKVWVYFKQNNSARDMNYIWNGGLGFSSGLPTKSKHFCGIFLSACRRVTI